MRLNSLSDNELSWDVFGYYLYLPSTFVQHDPMLTDISWIHELMKAKPISSTLYQISSGPTNNTMYFFLMGMSILYLPFFLLGHLIAYFTDSLMDGFSLPYQYSIAIGTTVYTLIGLFYFRKILLSYFSDNISCIILFITVLGTNYLHFATFKNLETSVNIFNLLVILIWNTIQWHKHHRLKNLLGIGLPAALIILVKPSEIVCVLIPLFWGVYNKETIQQKWQLIATYKKQFILTVFAALLLLLPQLLYWKIATGSFIYDTYKNPGVGLDFLSPHILNVLFSFRKGWLVYTPIMIFALIGFVVFYKKHKPIFFSVLFYFLTTFYIISSWTEWWYGAGYGMRPLIPSYAVLALPLGTFLTGIAEQQMFKKAIVGTFMFLFIGLNLFQMWQIMHYILDLNRTSTAYYLAVFGKTEIKPETRNLLLVERSMSGTDVFKDEKNYNKRNIGFYDFNEVDSSDYKNYIYDSLSKSEVYLMDSSKSFSPNILTTYRGMTDKAYVWIRGSVDVFIPPGYSEELPVLVTTFKRKEGVYAYKTMEATKEMLQPNQWIKLKLDIISPEVRSENDYFQAYIWHRGKKPIYIDNFKMDIYEPK